MVDVVYSEHGRAMLAYATRLSADRATAEDVVGSADRAWRKPEVLTNGKGSTRGWLLNRACATWSSTGCGQVGANRPRWPRIGRPPAEQDHADRWRPRSPCSGAEGAVEEHRVVIDQLYMRGRSLGETAAVFGSPDGTVKSRSYYALRALRATIQREVQA